MRKLRACQGLRGYQGTKVTTDKPPRAPSSRTVLGKTVEQKKKGIYLSGYSFHIAREDLGSDAFMREFRATESSVP